MKEIWTISDVHGHYEHLVELLNSIGVMSGNQIIENASETTIAFLGDYVDRGDKPLETLELLMTLKAHGYTETILLGNHDYWLLRFLRGNKEILINDERRQTIVDIEASPLFNKHTYADLLEFYEACPYYYKLNTKQGNFRFAHAFYSSSSTTKPQNKQRHMLYGPTLDGKDEKGFPRRVPWYLERDKESIVIFGHYSLTDKVSHFKSSISVDCGVFKTGVLGAYEIFSGKEVYAVKEIV